MEQTGGPSQIGISLDDRLPTSRTGRVSPCQIGAGLTRTETVTAHSSGAVGLARDFRKRQIIPKLPAATTDDDQSFTPDSDHDDGDSSSLSSTVFSFQDTPQSTALDVRKGYEGATTYSEFDQAMMLETLKPFDLSLQ